jgi:hypothetical protein
MNKKAQSQIITTVLIILLVLASIVIVWQVVQGTVRGGAEQVESQSACLGMNLVIVSATNASTNNLVVRREPGAGSEEEVDFRVFVDGARLGTTDTDANLEELTSHNMTASLTFQDEVQVAPKLDDGTLCPLSTKFITTSA